MLKGTHLSKDSREKISNFRIGKKLSLTTRMKISKAKKGKPNPNGSKAKKGNKNPMFGKKQSLEHIEKRVSQFRGEKNSNWKGGIATEKQRRARAEAHRQALKAGNGGNHTVGEWETLKAQYNWICPACKRLEPEIKLTEDHIIPISKGGSDNIENIQPLCLSCNCIKHTKIIKYGI